MQMKYKMLVVFLAGMILNIVSIQAQDKDRILRSDDGGKSWKPSAEGFPEETMVSAFTIDGGAILASANDKGLFISNDNGESWSVTGKELPANVRALAKHNGKLFASPWRSGVYVSQDHGKTWKACNFGLTDLEVNDFLSTEQGLFIGTSTGIFYSWNDGKTWMKILSAAQVNSLTQDGDIMLAATARGIYRSSNGARTWRQVVSNSGVKNIYHSEYGLFATTHRDGLLRSMDGGKEWELAENGLPELKKATYSFIQSGNRLLIGQLDGTYYSTTHGIHWIKLDDLLGVTQMFALPNGVILAVRLFANVDGC
ncbi:MAG: hypothetical protein KDD15_23855 [Lewinella sp.]|nr:hypothetical protein [Lewinella sp.]